MRRITAMLVGIYMSLAFSVPMADAISVTARAKGDIAAVSGKGFESGAAIQWEGVGFGVVNSKGRFKFEDPLPTDCIGELIVGVSFEADVTVEGCTPLPPLQALVPQTGQTTSVEPDDDGFIQAGVPLPVPRFTVNNPDGTVTDNLTGLMWLQDFNCPAQTLSWLEALDAVAELNTSFMMSGQACDAYTATFDDWRLPNVRELHSLVHFGFSNPALSDAAGTAIWTTNGDAFTNVQASAYWSSTTFEFFPSHALDVDFFDGFVDSVNKTFNRFVLPVRGP